MSLQVAELHVTGIPEVRGLRLVLMQNISVIQSVPHAVVLLPILTADEVDAFLTKRGAQTEHEATLQAKTEFMQLWDGMENARGSRVLVMGATNRPWMVDEAVLR